MGNKINLSEVDCIFISYDEPNAEKNWIDLEEKCFWAKRVHGVKGSDECHKAAANLSVTDWFITVDADNIVDPAIFEKSIDLDQYPNTLGFSWPGLNMINGLRYGNGSLKLWRKDLVLKMKTHEAAEDDRGLVDFCWEDGYRSLIWSFSKTYPIGSPQQAWRAGFREGVKMSLVNGVLTKGQKAEGLPWHNIHRLKIWMSVGAHVDNGLWAILGARHGCWKANCTDWDYVEVRDFEKLNKIWKEVENAEVQDAIQHYGNLLDTEFGLIVPVLPPDISHYVMNLNEAQYRQAAEQIIYWKDKNCV